MTVGGPESLENLHVELGYVYKWDLMFVDGICRSRVWRCSRTWVTLSKIVDLYVETLGTCLPVWIMWQNVFNLGFPCTYVLNKHRYIKKSIGPSSYGEIYKGRSAGPAPRSRVSGWMTVGGSESLENLHVELGYVYKCDLMFVDGICRSCVWRCSRTWANT